MKIQHRVPRDAYENSRSDGVSERYATEVEYATYRLERKYRRAMTAVEDATKRHDRAPKGPGRKKLAKLIHLRERELEQIRALMTPDSHGNRDSRMRKVRHDSGDLLLRMGHPGPLNPRYQ